MLPVLLACLALARPSAELHVVVTDEDCRPVDGAHVKVDAITAEVETNHDGEAILVLPEEADEEGWDVRADGFLPEEGTVSGDTLDVVLRRGSRIGGTLVGHGGQPVSGRVELWRLRPDGGDETTRSGCMFSPVEAEHSVLAADGVFEIPVVEPGDYDLVAVASGHQRLLIPSVALWRDAPREGLTVRLSRGPALSGRVVGATDGSPIAGAEVIVMDEDRRTTPPECGARIFFGTAWEGSCASRPSPMDARSSALSSPSRACKTVPSRPIATSPPTSAAKRSSPRSHPAQSRSA
ncbi:MAG: hypothetical protein U0166_27620 [Acidobacteriota bacterium]